MIMGEGLRWRVGHALEHVRRLRERLRCADIDESESAGKGPQRSGSERGKDVAFDRRLARSGDQVKKLRRQQINASIDEGGTGGAGIFFDKALNVSIAIQADTAVAAAILDLGAEY